MKRLLYRPGPSLLQMLTILGAVLIFVTSPVLAQGFSSEAAGIAQSATPITENGYDAEQNTRPTDGDEVPVFPLELKLKPFFDDNDYFAGWDATVVSRRFDIDDRFWDGDASFVREHIVHKSHEPRRIEKENVVLFFRQLVPSITGGFDLATRTIVQPDHVPHSASGNDLIEHWTWFANETADTLELRSIHREQFEPFFREFQHEYRRIQKYQSFLGELTIRAFSCEHYGTEWERPFYCGRGRLPATEMKAREFVAKNRSEMYWAYGVDPWAYMEEIAATSRPEPLRPPFRIGEVLIESTDRTDRMTDAANHLNQARNAVESSQKLLDERRVEFEEEETRFWETYNREQERLRPLEEAYRSQMGPLLRAERDRIKSISATTPSQERRIEQMRRRVETIGERLSLADEIYGGPENARIQKARLAAERDDLVATLGRIDAGPRSRTEEQLRATSERAEELFDRWDLEKRHSDRVIARAGRDLEMVANQVRRLRANVIREEEELEEALAEWRDVKEDSELAIGQVSSDDYRALFVSELPELSKLNSLIAVMRRGMSQAEMAHESARREMLDQGRSVETASANLIGWSYASALAQTSIEAVDQLKGFFKTLAKAGPYAAAAEAADTMFWNLATPPTVFDAPSSPFSLGAKEGGMAGKVLEKGAKITTKYPVEQMKRRGEINVRLRKEIPDIVDQWGWSARAGDFRGVEKATEALEKQLKDLEKLEEEFDIYALRKGGKELAKRLGRDVTKNLITGAAKDYVKDKIKKDIAKWLEGPAVSRYFEEQLLLAKAVRKFRMSGNLAWHLRDQLAQRVPERNTLLEKYDSEAGILVEKNRQFLARGGYAFFLYSSDDMENPNERGSPEELEAKVYLQGIELVEERSGHGRKFTIRAEDEERFDSTFPEMLTLTIKIQ